MPDSPAIRLLQHVWDHAQRDTGHSWLKLNHAMLRTLDLAVESGMAFHKDDFSSLFKRFRAGRWLGENGGEMFYRLAVLYRHASAWKTFESYAGRKPFVIKGASFHSSRGDGPMGQGLPRVVIGAEFRWNGERVTVTSFNDQAKCFTACSYTRTPYKHCRVCKGCTSGGGEKIKRRYTIYHSAIYEAKAEQKRRDAWEAKQGEKVRKILTNAPMGESQQ